MKVSSSAIETIDFGADSQVMITFRGGREYIYNCIDVDGFQNDLTDVIDEGESVGKFVNRAIKAELLQSIEV